MPPERTTEPKPNSRFVFSTMSSASFLVTIRALPRGARLSGICKWLRLRRLTSFSHHLCFLSRLTAFPCNSSLIVMARSLESDCSPLSGRRTVLSSGHGCSSSSRVQLGASSHVEHDHRGHYSD